MNSQEFSPYAYFIRVMHLWWLVALAIFLGGTFGYIFYHLRPPLYEATATYLVTIDLEQLPIKSLKEDLIQYNEDLALGTTEQALISPQVLNDVIVKLKSQGILLTPYNLLKNSTIERNGDTWELRFRSESPQQAQMIVNTWASIGYQAMISWKQTGKTPKYLIFQPPSEAQLPQEPVLYNRNRVMIAGALIGFIIGVLVSGWVGRRNGKLQKNLYVHD